MSRSASYKSYTPASDRASAAARGASRKKDTTPELLLSRALWRAGARYRKSHGKLPGRPDLVFLKARVVVFCDGDFWHGRNWPARKAKLAQGHNASYWTEKIEGNIARDLRNNEKLASEGWQVLRFWETDIKTQLGEVVETIMKALAGRTLRNIPLTDF